MTVPDNENPELPGILQLIFHPRRWRNKLAEMGAATSDLSIRLQAAESLLEAQRMENVRLDAANTSLAASNRKLAEDKDQLEIRVKTLSARLREVNRELDDRKDTETQIKELALTVERVEEMKKGYEERIARLRSRLKEISHIDMTPPKMAPPPVSEEKESGNDEWLRPLPEI